MEEKNITNQTNEVKQTKPAPQAKAKKKDTHDRTRNTATGAASGDLTLDIKGSLFPVANRTRLTFDLSGTSGRMTLSNHLRNQGTLTFDLSLSLAPSSAPVSAPPKDAVLTPLDELN